MSNFNEFLEYVQEQIKDDIHINLDKINISGSIKPLSKNQDFIKILSGTDIETNEKWKGAFLADGHGKIQCPFMSIIKNIQNYEELLSHTEPIQYIKEKINVLTYKCDINSGMTFILVKIYENKIITYSIGDSSVFIFINDNLIYNNIHHNAHNINEINRLKYRAFFEKSKKPNIISKNEICMIDSNYIKFKFGNFKLAVTQSLGHHNSTGIFPEKFETEYSNDDKIRIVVGSDGYFDMHCINDEDDMNDLKILSTSELVSKAESRWKQTWKYVDKNEPDKINLTTFPDYDDISILVLQKD
jgi:serine/threonine protein phosphatase PrpC